MARNASNLDDREEPPIGFHFHFYRKPFPIPDIERAIRRSAAAGNQPADAILFYVVLGRAFAMDSPIRGKVS